MTELPQPGPRSDSRGGARIRLAHFCGGFRGLGGVESVLQRHWAEDASWGLDSRFLVYFEQEAAGPAVDRVDFLGIGAGTTIRACRQRIRRALGTEPPDLAVYHGFWGMPYLADLDRAERRLLFLHGDVPRFDEYLVSRGPWVDGVLCVSRPLEEAVHRLLPGLGRDRVRFIPYPVYPPDPSGVAPRPGGDAPGGAGRPVVVGICGRIIREQKRVDRIPAVLRHWDEAGLDYRLEMLGDGPERAWLEGAVAGNPRVMFHGRKSGPDYWRILAGWDVILFVSDYEGTPIAMVEAMTQGVIPLYPRNRSGGDAYATAVRGDLLYEPDDFGHVTRVLRGLGTLGAEGIAALRARSREQVGGHTGEAYQRTFAQMVADVRRWPRVGVGGFPRRPFPVDHLSFAALERLGGMRRRLRAWLGR